MYKFDFVDAPFDCQPAPGIQTLFKSSNYTWWPKPTVNAIRGAHRWLLDYIEEHGPYDAVLCFSQGCSVAASFLMYHYRETPNEPLPFHGAMFICGGFPLPVLEDLGVYVSQEAHDLNAQTAALLHHKAGQLAKWAQEPGSIKPGVGLWNDTADLLHDPDVMPGTRDVFGLDMTTFPDDIRIKIPTVHVYGAKDPRWPAGVQLAYMCENPTMFDHQGGHDIPRSTEISEKLALLVRQLEGEIFDLPM